MTEPAEKTCNQWIKEMAAAGFDGTYRATNGKVVINGVIKKSGETTAVKTATVDESRQAIKQLFKNKG